jgi:hypothetical protein
MSRSEEHQSTINVQFQVLIKGKKVKGGKVHTEIKIEENKKLKSNLLVVATIVEQIN